MRKSLTFLVLTLISSLSFAESVQNENNLFKCVKSGELTLNSECLSQTIESNVKFKDFQTSFHADMSEMGGNVMATMQFYPELMEIRIIAHDDETSAGALVMQTTEQPEKLL